MHWVPIPLTPPALPGQKRVFLPAGSREATREIPSAKRFPRTLVSTTGLLIWKTMNLPYQAGFFVFLGVALRPFDITTSGVKAQNSRACGANVFQFQ